MRNQYYNKDLDSTVQNDQPQIYAGGDGEENNVAPSKHLYNEHVKPQHLSSTESSMPHFGQYSKSIRVNTQSATHSYIYDPDMPIFDLDHSANVTALLDKTAVLNCRVRNIGNKTVSMFTESIS